MAIEQKYVDLINADIDGEITAAEQADLQAFLADSVDGRELHAELMTLNGALDALEEQDPPPYLRHVIMSRIPTQQVKRQTDGFLYSMFMSPVLRYAGSFAAGALLMMSVIGSDRISDTAFDDVSGLVGTMTDPAALGPADDKIDITQNTVAGTISLRSAGSMLVLDFDLMASEKIDIIADYTDKTIWFNGFAQLESSGTSVSAETGRVSLSMEGKRRYAVFLHNEGGRETTVNLRFKVDGEVVHEASLNFTPSR
jgi:hypothetical protein